MTPPIRVFTDGGARGNPGPAGLGVHAETAEGKTLADLYAFLGKTTNNVAEYAALLVALAWATRSGHGAVHLFSDSELLVRQFNGQYKVRNQGLRPLFRRGKELAARIALLEVGHVPRSENHRADALANRAIDEESGNVASPLSPAFLTKSRL